MWAPFQSTSPNIDGTLGCHSSSSAVFFTASSVSAPAIMPNEVGDKFDPLLQIKLIDSFVLTLHMVVNFSQDIDILKILAVNKQVQGVVEIFDKKGVKVSIVFDFEHEHGFWTHHQRMEAGYRVQDKFWDFSRAVNRSPLDFFPIHTETVPVGTVLNFSVRGEKAQEVLRFSFPSAIWFRSSVAVPIHLPSAWAVECGRFFCILPFSDRLGLSPAQRGPDYAFVFSSFKSKATLN
ncbi:hypothetical protein BDU57DRAFT_156464 [Ampelomyces quisqualis]|uniref:Uncharacterized protein n=1 Tax=Ampelomyces quisqualis TaxID=50730 RepID=A0A6A5QVX2_AMPQU|nr:hypothetical protein BDU57DRAFT_156464 [Ampelomyces quisqualis]